MKRLDPELRRTLQRILSDMDRIVALAETMIARRKTRAEVVCGSRFLSFYDYARGRARDVLAGRLPPDDAQLLAAEVRQWHRELLGEE
jgi:hypothetical protein